MKITIVGAGNVGGLAAMRIAQQGLGEVCLIDIAPGLAKAKSYDLDDCRQILRQDYSLTGTEDIAHVSGSHIVVITAGLARKPGMTREDLLRKNSAILRDVCLAVKAHASNAVVIVVTNPLDVMTYYAVKTLGFPRERVFGMGVTLDGSRFANLIAVHTRVPVSKIKPMVIGSHGEAMLPLARLTLVDGKPLPEIIKDTAVIDTLVQRTVDRGKEIVGLLGSGSAYFAPSAAIAQLVAAIAKDQKVTLGVSAFLRGEYGMSDICIGVPCVVSKNGIEKIVELALEPQEQKAFRTSAESIKDLQALFA